MKDISVILKRSPETILHILEACRNLPMADITGPKLHSGRLKKLLRKTKHVLKIKLMKNPYNNAQHLISKYPDLFWDCSPRTLQRYERVDCGMPVRKAAAKFLFTKARVKVRLRFCHNYKHFDSHNWSRVMWNDESLFKLISAIQNHVRRPSHISSYTPHW